MAKILGHPVLFLFLITLHPAMAEEERLTLEWIFSDDRRLATAAPKHAWLDTGDIVLYDITKKQSERTIELLDPETGRDVAPGDSGIVVIHDLVNTGNIAAIQTADLGKQVDAGFEIEGCIQDAEARGCSIAADIMLMESS